MNIYFARTSLLALGLASVACSKDKPPVAPVAPPAATTAAPTEADDVSKIPEKSHELGNIQLGPKLAKLCDIPIAYFAFDSANLSSDASGALDALAACFTTGPAKGKGMRIVGHADPRGETQYNFALGQRRAGSVEKHITDRGVPAAQVESSSQGELDATGTDEASWAKDRKVEIFLAE